MRLRDRIRERLLPQRRSDAMPIAPSGSPPVPSFGESQAELTAFGKLVDRLDSIRNVVTGLGTASDKGAAGRPDVFRVGLNYRELTSLYRFNGYARRVIDIIPNDATRKGWRVDDDTDNPDVLAEENKRLSIETRVNEAYKWARLYGGSNIMIVTKDDIPPEFRDDPGSWLQQPLDLERVIAVENLVVLDRLEAQPVSYTADIRNPRFREPELWSVSPTNQAGSMPAGTLVHSSRMVYFPGALLPPSWRFANFGFDDPILDSIWDQLQGKTITDQALRVLANEIKVDVIKVKNLAAMSMSDQSTFFNMRMKFLQISKSLLNAVFIDEEETYESKDTKLTGWKDVNLHSKESFAAVAGMSQQLLYGDAPGGLNTDGASGRDNHAEGIAGVQEMILKPRIVQIDEVLLAAKEGPTDGVIPDRWDVEFFPLDELTETQQADLEKTHAETDQIRIDTGVVVPEHVTKSRYGSEGYQNQLLPVEGADELDTSVQASELDLEAARKQLEKQQGEQEQPEEEPKKDAVTAPVFFMHPLADEALEEWLVAVAAVRRILGEDLDIETRPHVTVLFMGDVDRRSIPKITEIAREQVNEVEPHIEMGTGIFTFEPSAVGGPGRIPIALGYGGWGGLRQLNERLLRALAEFISYRQFPEFIAHATIGYIDRELTEAEKAQLLELDVGRVEWRPSRVQMLVDGELEQEFAMKLKHDSEDDEEEDTDGDGE